MHKQGRSSYKPERVLGFQKNLKGKSPQSNRIDSRSSKKQIPKWSLLGNNNGTNSL